MAKELNTIILKGKGHHDEGVASGAIKPGAAIELAGGTYAEQSSAQAAALKGGLKIATEAALNGGKTITDAYAADDVVFFYVPLPGDHVNVLVKSGEDIDKGDKLVVEGGGSGLFVEAAGAETKFQLEAVEDSGGALAENDFVACRVL